MKEEKKKICSLCQKECTPVRDDNSFSYSYGSINSIFRDFRIVSDCCLAEIIEKEEEEEDENLEREN